VSAGAAVAAVLAAAPAADARRDRTVTGE